MDRFDPIQQKHVRGSIICTLNLFTCFQQSSRKAINCVLCSLVTSSHVCRAVFSSVLDAGCIDCSLVLCDISMGMVLLSILGSRKMDVVVSLEASAISLRP